MERAGVPGQCSGIVRKVHSFEEVDAVGEGCVLLFARSMQSNVRNTPTLFAALLRVKGIVAVNGPMMWMHHLAQVACECGVPVVQILPIDQVVDPLQRPADPETALSPASIARPLIPIDWCGMPILRELRRPDKKSAIDF